MKRPVLVASFMLLGCGPSASTRDTEGSTPTARDVVVLDTAAVRLGGIEVGVADTTSTLALSVTGAITYDANRVSHVGSRTDGRVVELGVDLGSRVRRGQVLVELESPEVGQIRADEQQAEALVRIARENFERERRLEQQGITSRKELLEAEADLRRAEAALRSATDRLRVLGAGHGDGGHFDLFAPFDGVVVTRNMSLGQMASPTDTLVTIADLSRVWIELDIFERDFARVRPGQAVAVTTAAYVDRRFPGRIVYVADVLDPAKRTARARVEIPNGDGALKPGMFATATIAVPAGANAVVVVPDDAVQDVEGQPSVFVPGDTPGEFRVVPVEVGDRLVDRRIVVRSGLVAGARVVVRGAFVLRSELARAELQSGEH
ncbi:MAG: efflux RND transporter periplasmic adaptor subunit [Gemmatimonadaceae bacterium]|nr:efflux RND transporter periplasmic adaptor subunit [Gemmatimonadaceae bacterium]